MIPALVVLAVLILLLQLLQLGLALRRKDADAGTAERFDRQARELREEVAARVEQSAAASRESFDKRLVALIEGEHFFFQNLQQQMSGGLQAVDARLFQSLGELARANLDQLAGLRAALDQGIARLQASNESRLEEMRRTVDEKLHGTLERRLGESFSLVSERLEQVHRGLGEMQTLAHGVGDLKRLMSNVKARGTWGEIQLRFLLEQMLTPGQYAANVEVRRGSGERVEFALRLPGSGEPDAPVWLPIDAKLHQEDYQRLLDAQDGGDPDGATIAGRALERTFRSAARTIAELYVHPPETTDFAILFVPVEGLYAEILRRPGLVDGVQREFRVMVAGPTTLCALLSSLQMGFRTLAIQQRSSEVWQVLGAVKTEFDRFGGLLERAQKKIQEAGSAIDQARTRSGTMGRKLRAVQELPTAEAQDLLGLPDISDGKD
jgi:DNA recombination protein RmuC